MKNDHQEFLRRQFYGMKSRRSDDPGAVIYCDKDRMGALALLADSGETLDGISVVKWGVVNGEKTLIYRGLPVRLAPEHVKENP